MSEKGKSADKRSAQSRTGHFSKRGRGTRILIYGLVGLLTGMLLGLVLKAVQQFSGHEVYRLLLNADYVPVLKEFRLSEFAEFVIHLVISIVLCMVLGWVWESFSRRGGLSRGKVTGATIVIGIVIGALLYPTTLLSSGGTPPIDSLPSWSWWLIVHAVYGACSGLLLDQAMHMFRSQASGY